MKHFVRHETDGTTDVFSTLLFFGHFAVADHAISTGHNIKWDHFD